MKLSRLTTLIILGASLTAGVSAENYPSRSDMLWVTNPDHPDWLYETGDSARISIELYRYGVPASEMTVNYSIGTDMLQSAQYRNYGQAWFPRSET